MSHRFEFSEWCLLPTPLGEFRMYDTGDEHVRVVCLGDLREQGAQPLVRIHSSCLASEVFAARDCDCADQLRESMKLIAAAGSGIIVHLHQEGRGHGLSLKIRAVAQMQRDGLDTVAAFDALGLEQDVRRYDAAARVLKALGIGVVRLITNNPRKLRFLESVGIRAERVSTHPMVRPENREYLTAKRSRLGHLLSLDADDGAASPIQFYHSDQPWGALSNLSAHAIFVRDRIWATVEHFYQAQKFQGTPSEEAIRRCETPLLAKRRSRELESVHARVDWSCVKEQVMLDGLRAKFQQHPDLGALLVGTGIRQLVEHTSNDAYWGDAGDGSGMNRLGHLLMRVRAELLEGRVSSGAGG